MAVKKAPATTAAPAAAPAARKVTALKDKYTKTQILNEIAENTGLTRRK